MGEPTVRDMLVAAGEVIQKQENLGYRPAKAFVHNMPWHEFAAIIESINNKAGNQ